MRTKPWLLLALSLVFPWHLPGAEAARGATNRAAALQAVCARLGIGPGAVVADVGCGDGPDTMVFAGMVGDRGTVLAQEIDAAKLKKVVETADKKGFHQVVAVLGQSDDPRLPDGLADLIYMNRVFHHFSRPQAMLQRLRADLKPGGFLVVVDQQKGPLADWAPMDGREQQHHWTGETTVVRLAREAGFLFHDVLDGLWYEKPPFVLVFRKPVEPAQREGDPDRPLPLDAAVVLRTLPAAQMGTGATVFCGLDGGRAVLPALRAKLPATARLLDLIPEEWALSREEQPSQTLASGVEVLRSEKGDWAFPAEVHPGLVLFVDAFHRLWDSAALLRKLKQQMPDTGLVAVVDRKGPEAESRRLAGHHRRLSGTLVQDEMRKAGFRLRETLAGPAADRFCLLFGVDPASGASSSEASRAK